MPTTPVFVDAEGVVRDWINSLTGLVGSGNPLPLGAHLKRLRSPDNGAYVLLSLITGDDDYTAGGATRARISGAVYGITKADAGNAAAAYANAIRRLSVGNTVVGEAPSQTVILIADAITGPRYLVDGDEERYIVDADFYLAPQS